MQHEAELEAAGAVLIYLTTESPETIAAAKEQNQLRGDIRSVDPALWARWDLAQGKDPTLPHPTTLVVSPTGELVFKQTHVNFTKRVPPTELLGTLDSLGLASISEERSAAPDWDSATELRVLTEGDQVTLQLEVAEGFHVYGALESIGQPLAVRVDQAPELEVAIPDGQAKELPGLGQAYVLAGTVELPIERPPPLSGTLDLQICTESACSMPRQERWTSD